MLALDHDDHAARPQVLDQRVRHLRGETLLHLRAAGIDVDEARELGQPGDPPVLAGDVADVRDAVERDEVVLAGRVDLDVAHEHELVVPDLEERLQHVVGVLPEA